MEEFIILDDSRLAEMAQLYKFSFAGEPWNDDWSDPVQLSQYIKDAFAAYFFKRTTTSLRILQQLRSGMLFKHQKGPLLVIVRPGVSAHNEAINQRKRNKIPTLYKVCVFIKMTGLLPVIFNVRRNGEPACQRDT
ncbi:MAG: hypothetical protein K6E60_01750 [Saccharofermentans sp.]|nr:hypothetical protein [Saccharofermentans sp.]